MDTNEAQARLARQLRQQAYQIEQEIERADRHHHDAIPEYGFPGDAVIATSNERAAQARLLRAQAARLDGDDWQAARFEAQAERVRLTGAYA